MIACPHTRIIQSFADTARLRQSKPQRKVPAFLCRVELALPFVLRAGYLRNETGINQLLEYSCKTLFGDPQYIQKFGDGQAGLAVDEVKDPMMSTAEAKCLQNCIRIGREIPVGKEKCFD